MNRRRITWGIAWLGMLTGLPAAAERQTSPTADDLGWTCALCPEPVSWTTDATLGLRGVTDTEYRFLGDYGG